MATRYTFAPLAAEPPTTSFAELRRLVGRPLLAYDASAVEEMDWTFVAPNGLTAPYSLVVYGFMASATTGAIVLGAYVEAVTPGDALDLNSAAGYDVLNQPAAVNVPGTAGYEFTVTIPLTNNDSIAAGDHCRVRLRRVATDSGDTAAGDWYCTACALLDSA